MLSASMKTIQKSTAVTKIQNPLQFHGQGPVLFAAMRAILGFIVVCCVVLLSCRWVVLCCVERCVGVPFPVLAVFSQNKTPHLECGGKLLSCGVVWLCCVVLCCVVLYCVLCGVACGTANMQLSCFQLPSCLN